MSIYKIKLRNIAAFSFLFAMIICFSGCKKVKNNEIDATIYVKQYKTGTPIINAKVQVMRGPSGSGIGNSLVETLYTDGNGKVDYSATVDGDYMYYAEANKDAYFDTHNAQVSLTRGEKNFSTTIYMYAHSYVKLHVKNVNPVNQYDLFELGASCNGHWWVQGTNIDTTFLLCDYGYEFMAGFEDYGYNYAVTKNNIQTVTPFYFITEPFDTLEIDINY